MAQKNTTWLPDRISYFISRLFVALGIIVFGFLAVNSFLFTGYNNNHPLIEKTLFRRDNLLVNLGVMVLFTVLVACAVYVWRRWPRFFVPVDKLRYIGFVVLALVCLVWVLFVRSKPMGEAYNVLKCALQFSAGDYGALVNGNYLYLFPHQLGYVAVAQAVFAVFGWYNYQALYLLNALSVLLIYGCLTAVARQLFHDKGAQAICVCLVITCLPLVAFVTFAYGILLSLSLCCAALWCTFRFWDSRKLRYLLLGGGCMAIALLIKSNAAIFGIALGIVLLLDFLEKPGKAVPVAVLAFAVILWGGRATLHGYYESRSGFPIAPGTPSIVWVAMGYENDGEIGPGWYNGRTYELLGENGLDVEATQKEAHAILKFSFERMMQEGTLGQFLFAKTVSQWNEPTFGCLLFNYETAENTSRSVLADSLFYGAAYGKFTFVAAASQLVVYRGALACFILRRKTLTWRHMLPFIVLLGGFMFHTFVWEAKAQYILNYFVLAMPYAAAGFAHLARGLLDRLGEVRRGKIKTVAFAPKNE